MFVLIYPIVLIALDPPRYVLIALGSHAYCPAVLSCNVYTQACLSFICRFPLWTYVVLPDFCLIYATLYWCYLVNILLIRIHAVYYDRFLIYVLLSMYMLTMALCVYCLYMYLPFTCILLNGYAFHTCITIWWLLLHAWSNSYVGNGGFHAHLYCHIEWFIGWLPPHWFI